MFVHFFPTDDPTPVENILSVQDNFLILSGFTMDPMSPICNKLEEALEPVVRNHTDRACRRLVHLFMHTLELEEVSCNLQLKLLLRFP